MLNLGLKWDYAMPLFTPKTVFIGSSDGLSDNPRL
jgi:hypothetical protein